MRTGWSVRTRCEIQDLGRKQRVLTYCTGSGSDGSQSDGNRTVGSNLVGRHDDLYGQGVNAMGVEELGVEAWALGAGIAVILDTTVVDEEVSAGMRSREHRAALYGQTVPEPPKHVDRSQHEMFLCHITPIS